MTKETEQLLAKKISKTKAMSLWAGANPSLSPEDEDGEGGLEVGLLDEAALLEPDTTSTKATMRREAATAPKTAVVEAVEVLAAPPAGVEAAVDPEVSEAVEASVDLSVEVLSAVLAELAEVVEVLEVAEEAAELPMAKAVPKNCMKKFASCRKKIPSFLQQDLST